MHTTLKLTTSILRRVSILSLAGFGGFAGSAALMYALGVNIREMGWTFCVFLNTVLGVQALFNLVLRLPLTNDAQPLLAADAPLDNHGHIKGVSLFLFLSGLAFGASVSGWLAFGQETPIFPPVWLGTGLWLYVLVAAFGLFMVTSYLRATFDVSEWLSQTMHQRVTVAIDLIPPFALGLFAVWLGLKAQEALFDGTLSLWLALPIFAMLVVAASWAQAYATVVLCRAYASVTPRLAPSSDAHRSR